MPDANEIRPPAAVLDSVGEATVTRPANLLYAVDEWPPSGRLILLGLQYAVQTSMYLVIVTAILGRAHVSEETAAHVISMAFIALAIGALLQALHKGPIGSGFLAPPVFSAIYLAPSLLAAEAGGLPLVFGMTIFAALVQMGLGLVVQRLRILFQPSVGGIVIVIVGFELGAAGIRSILSAEHGGALQPGWNLLVALVPLAVGIGASVWGRGLVRLLCNLLAVLAGLAVTMPFGLVEGHPLAAIASEPWFQVPDETFLGFRFSFALAPMFLAAAIAATLRTVGVVSMCQRINNAAWKHPDMANIRRGVLADGLASLLSGLIGAPGLNIGPSLVSISSLTGATSRVIAHVTAIFLVACALLPPLGPMVLSIPQEVAGAILVINSAAMIANGMQVIQSGPLDVRSTYLIGLTAIITNTRVVFADDYAKLPVLVQHLTSDGLSVGLLAAMLLTLVFRIGTKRQATFHGGFRPGAGDPVATFITDTAATLAARAGLAARCVRAVDAVLSALHVDAEAEAAIRLTVSWDGFTLGTDMRYEPPLSGQAPPPLDATAITRLKRLARSRGATRAKVTVDANATRLRLAFEP